MLIVSRFGQFTICVFIFFAFITYLFEYTLIPDGPRASISPTREVSPAATPKMGEPQGTTAPTNLAPGMGLRASEKSPLMLVSTMNPVDNSSSFPPRASHCPQCGGALNELVIDALRESMPGHTYYVRSEGRYHPVPSPQTGIFAVLASGLVRSLIEVGPSIRSNLLDASGGSGELFYVLGWDPRNPKDQEAFQFIQQDERVAAAVMVETTTIEATKAWAGPAWKTFPADFPNSLRQLHKIILSAELCATYARIAGVSYQSALRVRPDMRLDTVFDYRVFGPRSKTETSWFSRLHSLYHYSPALPGITPTDWFFAYPKHVWIDLAQNWPRIRKALGTAPVHRVKNAENLIFYAVARASNPTQNSFDTVRIIEGVITKVRPRSAVRLGDKKNARYMVQFSEPYKKYAARIVSHARKAGMKMSVVPRTYNYRFRSPYRLWSWTESNPVSFPISTS